MLLSNSPKIIVTDHCINQVLIRKYEFKTLEQIKKYKKRWLFFSINVFQKMMFNEIYRWEKCLRSSSGWNTRQIYHKKTWYKFIYEHNIEKNEYILITFILKSELDIEIWKIMKNLWIVKKRY